MSIQKEKHRIKTYRASGLKNVMLQEMSGELSMSPWEVETQTTDAASPSMNTSPMCDTISTNLWKLASQLSQINVHGGTPALVDPSNQTVATNTCLTCLKSQSN